MTRVELVRDGIYVDTNVSGGVLGVRGTTNCWIKRSRTNRKDWPWKYEARMGIAILGVQFAGVQPDNPFDPEFRDNYVKGVGMTQAVAIRKMKEELKTIGETIWV